MQHKLNTLLWNCAVQLKGVVYDSGESLLVFELNSQTNTLQCSFKLGPVTHSISLSSVRASVVTYYIDVFSGNVAKALVLDALGWWLYPRPIYRARAVCEHQTVSSAHTQNGKLADREEIFSEFDKKCIGLESQTTPLTLARMAMAIVGLLPPMPSSHRSPSCDGPA